MIGLIWFLIVVVGGSFLLEHVLTLYPEASAAMFPFMFASMFAVLIGGRMIIRKVLNAIK